MTAVLDPAPPPGSSSSPPGADADWRARLRPALDARAAARGGWLVALLVTALAGAVRLVRLSVPEGRMFDEVYYVCDAQNLLRVGVELGSVTATGDTPVEPCTPTGDGAFVVHPPLGKWLIALGIRAFGLDEFGWRIAAAVAGTLTVLVVVRAARRMTGSTWLGALAGLLVALDGLHLVQSRIAMLDVFLVLFVVVAFACLLVDRDAVRRRLASAPAHELVPLGPPLGWRPWRLAAGVALGCAVAVKWSGLYYVAALVLLALAWEVGARRTAGSSRPVRAVLLRTTAPALGALLVVPTLVYLVSWAGWFASDEGWDRQWAQTAPAGAGSLLPDGLRSLWHYHAGIYGFHVGLEADHVYQSRPVGWLFLARPISYYYPAGLTAGSPGCDAPTCSSEVLALGNPALWWAAVPVLVALLWLWLARRDWRAAAVLVGVAVAIAPWVRDDLSGRTMFYFYALPAVPFLAIGCALAYGWALGGPGASPRRRRAGAALVAVHLALVVAAFAFFYPVWTAVVLPYEAWDDRMWFSSWI